MRTVTLETASASLGFPRFGAPGSKPLPSDVQHSMDGELTQGPRDHCATAQERMSPHLGNGGGSPHTR